MKPPKKLSRREVKRVRIDVIEPRRHPRWGKNINKKAKRLAGEVKVGRIEDLPDEHPARQGNYGAEARSARNSAPKEPSSKEDRC